MSIQECKCRYKSANVDTRVQMSIQECKCRYKSANVDTRVQMSIQECKCRYKSANKQINKQPPSDLTGCILSTYVPSETVFAQIDSPDLIFECQSDFLCAQICIYIIFI